MPRQFLAMEPGQWARRLHDLLDDCDGSHAAEQDSRLREGWCLLLRTPLGLPAWCEALPPEPELEAMIAAEAWESAALALLPPDAGYMLSRGGNGNAVASVVLPGQAEEATSVGETPALAVLAALALALIGEARAVAPRRGASTARAAARLN